MLDTKNKLKEQYIAELENLEPADAPKWARELRKTGLDLLASQDFPGKKTDGWRETDISPILEFPFALACTKTLPESAAKKIETLLYNDETFTELVFVDGKFIPDLSKIRASENGTRIKSLNSVSVEDEAIIKRNLETDSKKRDIFTALNDAHLSDGAFVHVPAGHSEQQTIHLLFISTASEPQKASYPRNMIVVEEGAQAKLIESYAGVNDELNYLTNVVTQIHIARNAKLEHYKLVEEGAAGYHLATTYVSQKDDSLLEAFAFSLGGKITRNDLRIVLDGSGAECRLHGLYLNDDRRLTDNTFLISHASPNCTSKIEYKGVMDDRSKSVFCGRVVVEKDAQKTNSQQVNRNLLLSDHAHIDTKPELEIYADDVKCTHGTTVGQPPEEMLFYFRTRGIGEAAARAMLTRAFANEITQKVPLALVRDRIYKHILEKYAG